MADKAKQFLRSDKLVGLLRQQDYYNKAHYVSDPLYGQAADRIEALEAKVDGLRDLLVRGYVVCDGDDEDAVAFRNDARAALAGDSHD